MVVGALGAGPPQPCQCRTWPTVVPVWITVVPGGTSTAEQSLVPTIKVSVVVGAGVWTVEQDDSDAPSSTARHTDCRTPGTRWSEGRLVRGAVQLPSLGACGGDGSADADNDRPVESDTTVAARVCHRFAHGVDHLDAFAAGCGCTQCGDASSAGGSQHT